MGFEWQTGDDEGEEWHEPRPNYRYRSARWRWYLLGVIALLAAGIITWRLAERRVEASSEQMRADVRASHELVQRAAASSDVELLRTALSGRDEEWTATQRELADEGYSYTAAPRLLLLEPVGAPEERSLTLAPNLRSAELVLAQEYTPTAASVLTGPVVLEQTHTYRRGANRWLLAPPDEEFWGVQRSTRTGRVVVEFPERDEELARRLADDLSDGVEALCALQSGRCPPELVVTVTLEDDPASLLAFTDSRQMLRSGARVSLPAPSLLGIPQDDAGYRALHDAYARYLYSALAPQLTNWECCGHALFWQALLQARLNDLGLAPPLLSPAETFAALDLVTNVDDFFITLSPKWQGTRPVGLHTPLPLDVRVLVAFLLDQGHTPLQLQLSMSGPTTAFDRWWSSYTGVAPTDREAMRPELVSFVQSHYEQAPLPDGLTLPEADILLACGPNNTLTRRIWRYDLQTESWTEELVVENADFSALVTDEDGYFVTSIHFAEQEETPSFLITVWRGRPGMPPERVADIGDEGWIPLARRGPVVPAIFLWQESGEPMYGSVDLGSCSGDSCAYEETPGYVIPSPGGAYELAMQLLQGVPGLLLRPAGGEWEALPQQGAMPFWLDDESFAYFTFDETASAPMRLVVQTVSGESAVLADDDSMPPTGEPGSSLLPSGAFYHAPSDAIYLLGRQASQVNLFAISRPAGGSWLVPQPLTPTLVASTKGSPSFSNLVPVTHDRWMVMTVDEPPGPWPLLWVVDLAGEEEPFTVGGGPNYWVLPTYDWSPDGEWLAWPTTGALRLVAPAYRDASGAPYQLYLPHETQDDCGFIAWLRR